MKDKVTVVREHILDLLESGTLQEGDKLPGARELCDEVDASFVMTQNALASLVRDGILDSVSRRGTFVRQGWADRALGSNFVIYRNPAPWLGGLTEILSRRLPKLRISRHFSKSFFELRTTTTVQENRYDYMDLSGLLKKVYPDDSIFFTTPFRSFYTANGALIGIPFIFSPRVMFYNPRLLTQAGCPLPVANWVWDDFIGSIKTLKRTLPGNNIFNWDMMSFNWMNFVFRAGGTLIDPGADDPVKIDDPRTRHGLKLHTELRELLGRDDARPTGDFAKGELAFLLGPRELLCDFKHADFADWRTVPLPLIPGGTELTTQATDLICVRKDCTDMDVAHEFIKVMLSEETQDFIGSERFGIPIRKSSALKSINFDDPCDALFMSEMSKMSAEYNLDSPELSMTVIDGIRQIWRRNADVEECTRELADAVRTFLKIKKSQNSQ